MVKRPDRARLAAVVLVLCMAPAAAMAYIDPGNGAYMVQALFTLVGAALFYLRHPIRTMTAAWHWVVRRQHQSVDANLAGSAVNEGDDKERAASGASSGVIEEQT
jgi:hypothetical protein